ncbi:MAG: DUF1598 domain-containing protein [Planctomycetales bacterium]
MRACIRCAVSLAVGSWLLTLDSSFLLAQGAVGGVSIDAEGMLRDASRAPQDGRLQRLRADAAVEPTGAVALSSPLRKVSLRRLEQEVAALHADGKPLPADVACLAGLQQIRHVFVCPEEGDIVLAGPAEGWKGLPEGDWVGRQSGRPVLSLEDLIVALRYAFASGTVDAFFGCSIEPSDAGVRRHGEYVSRLKGLDRSRSDEILRGMEEAMGPQQILLFGAPPATRFARQMVAADYRLKRLALAHDPSPVKSVPSFLDFASRQVRGGPQPQHRWWFVGHFDAIRETPDHLAFEFEGPGLRVDTAPATGVLAQGGPSAKPSKAATQFAEAATRGFPELAQKIPAFAQLQNLVGLAVAAEIIRQAQDIRAESASSIAAESCPPRPDDAPPESGFTGTIWKPVHFLDVAACPITEFAVPKQTPSLANVRIVKDRQWLFSISGGVEINAATLADPSRRSATTGKALGQARQTSTPSRTPAQWWWD